MKNKRTLSLVLSTVMLSQVIGVNSVGASVVNGALKNGTAPYAVAANYSTAKIDDYSNHWAAATILKLINSSIITGYSDGSIKPDNAITRAEFVTLVNKLFGYTEEASDSFSDVSAGAWYASQFAIAKKAGYVSGDDNGHANPTNNITRAEVCSIIARALELDSVSATSFTDSNSIPSWAKGYIGALSKAGIINGYPDGSFGAGKNITRAEAFTIINNTLEYDSGSSNGSTGSGSSSSKSKTETETETATVDESTETTTKKTSSGGGGGGGRSHSSSTSSETTTQATTTSEIGNVAYLETDDTGVELNNFSVDKFDVLVNTTETVKFSVEVIADFVLDTDSVYVADADNNRITSLYDDGTNGDDVAGDGIYSAAVQLSSATQKNVKYAAKYDTLTSNEVVVAFYNELEDSDVDALFTVQEKIVDIEKPFLNESGYVSETDKDALFAAIAAYLETEKTAGTIKRYTVGSESISIVMASGMRGSYEAPIEGVNGGGSNVSIATYQPNSDLYSDALRNLSTKGTDGSATSIAAAFDEYNFATNLDNSDVSLDALKNLNGYGVVLWDGHGGYDEDTEESVGSKVLIGTPTPERGAEFWRTYSADIEAGRILTNFGSHNMNNNDEFTPRLEISGGFIQKYVGYMGGAYVYIGACSSGRDMQENGNHLYKLAQSFLDKGATAVIGNSGTINSEYNKNMQKSVNEGLLKTSATTNNYYTLSEALAYAKSVNGNTDANGSAPVIFSGSKANNYRLANLTKGYVAGSVTSGETGAYIANAYITLSSNGVYVTSARTDANGYYNVEVVPGEYVARISAPGYEAEKILVTVESDTTTYNRTALMNRVSLINEGIAKGAVRNAITNAYIEGVTISLRAGWNNTNGTVVSTTTSTSGGQYQISGTPGFYTMEASKDGFITGYENIVILNVDILTQDIIISPNLDAEGSYRIQLSWIGDPSDLDLHLTGPACDGSGDRFHLYYPSSIGLSSGGEYRTRENPTYCDDNVTLDIDDMDYEGPETATILTQLDGVYRVSVLDFTNHYSSSSSVLSNSGATVTIYKGSTVVAVYNVPSNTEGTLWTVCEISGNRITSINRMGYETDSSDLSAFALEDEKVVDFDTDEEQAVEAVSEDATEVEPVEETVAIEEAVTETEEAVEEAVIDESVAEEAESVTEDNEEVVVEATETEEAVDVE